MSYLLRMVIPIKREFGRSLEVHQVLHDLPYVLGPRNSDASASKEASPAKPTKPAAGPALEKEVELSDDLRAQAIARYRSGLR
jgi:hypothetical protein